jgi:hypothetical protein
VVSSCQSAFMQNPIDLDKALMPSSKVISKFIQLKTAGKFIPAESNFLYREAKQSVLQFDETSPDHRIAYALFSSQVDVTQSVPLSKLYSIPKQIFGSESNFIAAEEAYWSGELSAARNIISAFGKNQSSMRILRKILFYPEWRFNLLLLQQQE